MASSSDRGQYSGDRDLCHTGHGDKGTIALAPNMGGPHSTSMSRCLVLKPRQNSCATDESTASWESLCNEVTELMHNCRSFEIVPAEISRGREH